MDIQWFVYMVQTECGSLYTGITTDVSRRFAEHRQRYAGTGSKGARFFAGRKPVAIVYQEKSENRARASQREYAIKQLSAREKRAMIDAFDIGSPESDLPGKTELRPKQ